MVSTKNIYDDMESLSTNDKLEGDFFKTQSKEEFCDDFEKRQNQSQSINLWGG